MNKANFYNLLFKASLLVGGAIVINEVGRFMQTASVLFWYQPETPSELLK